MLDDAQTLLNDLTRDESSAVTVADARRRAPALTNLLHEHRWREPDLILDIFHIDLGYGD